MPGSVSNLASNAINKSVRAGKGFTFFTLNKDKNGIIKITKSLEDVLIGVSIDGVTETVRHGTKKTRQSSWGFVSTFIASIVLPVIYYILNGISGRGVRRAGRRYINKNFLVPLHPLTNIEITKYFNHSSRFNGVFLRNNLPKIKDGVYMINLSDKKSKGTHWVSLFFDRNTALYLDSFEIGYILQYLLNKIKVK